MSRHPVNRDPTRRDVLRRAGGLLAGAALPSAAAVPSRTAHPSAPSDADQGDGKSRDTSARDSSEKVTGVVARYMVASRERALPVDVVRETKHRILDTLAAMISGSRLKPGELAIRYARSQGGVPEASVVATPIRTTAVTAALVNGMFAHADETDDFEPQTKAHPGCAVVPAALAVAERHDRSGQELIRSVALGYDLCCRWLMALGPAHVRATHRSAEGVSATFGAAAAAASLAQLDEQGMRYTLSYAAQQVSGVWSWERDLEHVEKAFDIAGMGARNGVTAALMVQAGFTAVADVLEGEHNALEAHSTEPRPHEMTSGLGSRFFVTETAIKTYSIGYPIQAALDAFLSLRREHALTPANVEQVIVRLPADGAAIVNDRPMPDINCQYLVAVALVDGGLSFDASHSYERMKDSKVLAIKRRVELVADKSLVDPTAPRSGHVEVILKDGTRVSHFTRFPPGTKERPLDTAGVNAKARGLIAPVLGAERAEAIIRRVNDLEHVKGVRELVRLLV